METKTVYHWNSLGFLQNYWITMRPYLMYVSASAGLVGLSLTDLPPSSIIMYGFAFFFSYGFGQALTDCFQLDTDEISSPYRPLIRGNIEKKEVLVVSIVCLVLTGVVLTLANKWNSIFALTGILGLSTYTIFKRRWWGGPWYNGWIVALLGLMGYLCEGISPRNAVNNPLLLPYLFTILCAYANFVLIGYFKDIDADKATCYETLPVVFGRKIAAWVTALLGAMTMITPVYLVYKTPSYQMAIFLILALAYLFLAEYQIFRVKRDDEAHFPIANIVRSYLLTLGLLICNQKPEWFLFYAIFYIFSLLTLRMRPNRQQI